MTPKRHSHHIALVSLRARIKEDAQKSKYNNPTYHEQDTITLHQRPDLVYLLHHKANGLPYAAFVDDKLVHEHGLRMISHSDLLPYIMHRREGDENAAGSIEIP